MLRCFICPLATKQNLRRNFAIFFVLCLVYVYSRQSWLTDAAIERQLAALAKNPALSNFVGASGKNKSAVAKEKPANASSKVVHLSHDKKLPLSDSPVQNNGNSKVKKESGLPQPTKNSVELNSQKKAA